MRVCLEYVLTNGVTSLKARITLKSVIDIQAIDQSDRFSHVTSSVIELI